MDKQCKKCLKTRLIDDFYKHSMMADGHISKCKECTKADVTENRNRNLDYYQNYDRKRYDSGGKRGESSKEAISRARERWVSSHQLERKVHYTVGNAIRDGRLIRPSSCSECGTKGRVDAHHEDYSKPFDVTWLCRKCHAQTWTKERKELQPRKRGGYKGSMVASRA